MPERFQKDRLQMEVFSKRPYYGLVKKVVGPGRFLNLNIKSKLAVVVLKILFQTFNNTSSSV